MKYTALRIRLASSQLIRKWAQRKLPNGKIISGQILNSNTVNYQTLKPETHGLFCERIFGPVNDYLCACGLPPLRGQKLCPNCEVELISSRVRRYRLGYIQLVTAVAHQWFFKARPNYLGLFLNLSNRQIENLLYCTQNICRTIYPKQFESMVAPERWAPLPSKRKRKRKKKKKEKEKEKNQLNFQRFWNYEKNPGYVSKQYCIERRTPFGEHNIQNYYCSPLNHGGIRDSALYFGFSLVSKMLSWDNHWYDFIYFMMNFPKKTDILNKYYPGPPGYINFCPPESRLNCYIGAQLIKTWLSQLTYDSKNGGRLLEIQLRLDLFELKHPDKINVLRRFKYLRSFRHKKMNPASMILCALPVLPPDLRPILPVGDNDEIAVSDFNKLYQNVLLRNKRLLKLTNQTNFNCFNSEALQYSQRLLQECVDNLIENNSNSNSNIKCLSDLFKGKKGRFRQNLLGKRVDYSGRSVIVVGPYLKIYEVGLPFQIAYELFQPFLIKSLMLRKKVQTIFGAKKILNTGSKFIWNLLKQIVEKHPLLLNRAPTLHRLSIQAFLPRLIEGQAILLHPLVCSAFNADFDGDQMGVHIPLCFEARGEAWKIMWSQNNLFSVATGNTICSPSQDMILGSCFLTTPQNFSNLWISQNPTETQFETQIKKQKLLEIRINRFGQSQKLRSQFCQYYHPSGTEIIRHIRTTYGIIKFHQNVL